MSANYERWPVYEKATKVRSIVGALSRRGIRGMSSELDHLRRSSSSVMFNIAEGAGKFTKADKINFYRIALGSANECNSVLNVVIAEVGRQQNLTDAKALTGEVIAMLIGLIKSIDERPD